MAFCNRGIETARLLIRPLVPGDVSDRYLSWLVDEDAKKWIASAKSTTRLRELRHYVEQRAGRDDVCFLGVFDKRHNLHIGNIKYEPIVPCLKSAVMGVLIGDPDYRGCGVFAEIFLPTVQLLHRSHDIHTIFLGVDVSNQRAVSAYRAVGFAPVDITDEQRLVLGDVTMKYSVVPDDCKEEKGVKCE